MFQTKYRSRRTKTLVFAGSAGISIALMFGMTHLPAATAAPKEAGCAEVETTSGNTAYDAEGGCGDYTPDIASADPESQQMALGLFMGALKFCIRHPDLAAAQAVGYDSGKENDGTHHFHPDNQQPNSIYFLYNPDLPSTAMVNDDDTIGGYMIYKYENMPYIGTIPRTHRHTKDSNPNDEMYHTYCKTTMEEAFRFKESNSQNPPSVAEMEATLLAAEQGGVSAVSKSTANVMPPIGAATLAGVYTGGRDDLLPLIEEAAAPGDTKTEQVEVDIPQDPMAGPAVASTAAAPAATTTRAPAATQPTTARQPGTRPTAAQSAAPTQTAIATPSRQVVTQVPAGSTRQGRVIAVPS